MRLSNFTDFGLRVLIYLGSNGDKLSTVSEISSAYGVSNNHLVKVVHHLSSIGLISSFKGRGGGIKLAIDPSTINIGKVIRELESDTKLVECFDDESNTCSISSACKLKGILKKAQNSFYSILEEYYLSDLVSSPKALKGILKIS